MTNPVAILLTDEQLSRLELIAEAREETLVATVQEAVTGFLHKDAEYRAYVQEGLDDIAAGRVHAWEDVRPRCERSTVPPSLDRPAIRTRQGGIR